MRLHHSLTTTLDLPLAPSEALAFVQDPEASLRRVAFMRGLAVEPGPTPGGARVSAAMPVFVPVLGAYELEFVSLLEATPRGARLHALPPREPKKGWAEVAGEAEVSPLPGGSRVSYTLDLSVHVALPEPEAWGGRALLKMVEVTAQKVVADIAKGFPEAIRAAAEDARRVYSSV